MKRKKRWIVMMSLMVLLSIWGVLTPESPELWMPDQYFDAANVAWMITATIFVLMMTPGLSFFYGGMVGRKNIISTILQSFIAMGMISHKIYIPYPEPHGQNVRTRTMDCHGHIQIASGYNL